MNIIIPAACSYWRWGGSGRQENINAICILGLNIVNDKVSKHNLHCQCIILILNDNSKVFLILWWWFLLLVLIGLVRLVYRAFQCRSRSCLLYQRNFFHCLVLGPPGCVTISSRWDSTRTSRSQRRSSRSRSLSRLRNSAIGELIFGKTTNNKYRQRYSHMPCWFIKVYQVCSLPNEQKPQPAVFHGLPRPSQSQICRGNSRVRGGRWHRLQPRYKFRRRTHDRFANSLDI